jgi:hypothetical protein
MAWSSCELPLTQRVGAQPKVARPGLVPSQPRNGGFFCQAIDALV